MIENKAAFLNDVIQNRQSIFPKDFVKKEISNDIIEQLLINATYAPTHKLTEPWFFRILKNEAKMKLGHFMANTYKSTTADELFLEKKYLSFENKMELTNTVIVISMQRDEAKRIPEWEEIAAVACAVQNIQLSCHAYNIGCYWSSPKLINRFKKHFKFKTNETCLGLLYLGYYNNKSPKVKRTAINMKTKWFV